MPSRLTITPAANSGDDANPMTSRIERDGESFAESK
jgi:hypothetical protein